MPKYIHMLAREDMPVPYAFGTVLAGYLMMFPFWAVGALWNRLLPNRPINPWILPSLWNILVYFCFAVTSHGFTVFKKDNDMLVGVGLLPAALGCFGAAWRWHKRKQNEDEDYASPRA